MNSTHSTPHLVNVNAVPLTVEGKAFHLELGHGDGKLSCALLHTVESVCHNIFNQKRLIQVRVKQLHSTIQFSKSVQTCQLYNPIRRKYQKKAYCIHII